MGPLKSPHERKLKYTQHVFQTFYSQQSEVRKTYSAAFVATHNHHGLTTVYCKYVIFKRPSR